MYEQNMGFFCNMYSIMKLTAKHPLHYNKSIDINKSVEKNV